jgi:hypothetical protein
VKTCCGGILAFCVVDMKMVVLIHDVRDTRTRNPFFSPLFLSLFYGKRVKWNLVLFSNYFLNGSYEQASLAGNRRT